MSQILIQAPAEKQVCRSYIDEDADVNVEHWTHWTHEFQSVDWRALRSDQPLLLCKSVSVILRLIEASVTCFNQSDFSSFHDRVISFQKFKLTQHGQQDTTAKALGQIREGI